MVIAVSVLWYAGYQDRKDKEAKLAQYTKEFLDKQKNIEAVAVKELQGDATGRTPIDSIPPLTISTSTASSTEQLRIYNLAVIEALKPLSVKRANEPQAVLEAIDKNDPSLLRPVVESRIYHQTVAQNLAQIVVPKEILTEHKKIISDLNFLVSILRSMEVATEQPQLALTNSKALITNYPVLIKDINNLTQHLVDRGVKLGTKDQIQIFVSFAQ